MITLFKAKSGKTSARTEDKIIHSKYDPVREAERFVKERLNKPSTSVIILGAGLGYAYEAVKRRIPEVKIIPVSYSKELYNNFSKSCTDSCIYLQDSSSFYHALFDLLLPSDLDGLSVLEWPVLAELFPDKSAQAHKIIQRVLKQLHADLTTTSYFGRRWVTNCIENFLSLDTVSKPPKEWKEFPLVIAASGPSLGSQIDLLKDFRDRYILWALPSSLAALDEAGIVPDLVISTDAGFYSRFNFHYLGTVPPAVASPLSAIPIRSSTGFRRVLLNQTTFFESTFIEGSIPYFYRIGENGTAAGSALETALVAGFSRIIFAGLDLAFYDIQEHVKPHPFDIFPLTESERTAPHYHKVFSRAFELSDRSEGISRGAYAYTIYASWFDTVVPGLKSSICRLGPVPYPVRGMDTVPPGDFPALLPGGSHSVNLGWRDAAMPSLERRRAAVEGTVNSWSKMITQYHSYPLESAVALLRSRSLFNRLLYTYDPLLVKMTLKHFVVNDRKTSGKFLDRLVEEAVEFYDSLLYRVGIAYGT